ncbi:acid phosphatase, partial [Bacillus nitratireducens]|nr:acid phosphatase [Bacillus nitratireducens]
LYEKSGKVKEVLAGTYEFGEKTSQYSQAAFNELQISYDNTRKVFENIASTREKIIQKYNDLKTAHQTYSQSKVAKEQQKIQKKK